MDQKSTQTYRWGGGEICLGSVTSERGPVYNLRRGKKGTIGVVKKGDGVIEETYLIGRGWKKEPKSYSFVKFKSFPR